MGLKDLFAAHDGRQVEVKRHIVHVEGMHCNSCERLVSDALAECGATDVTANHETGEVSFCGDLDAAAIAEAVQGAGFKLA